MTMMVKVWYTATLSPPDGFYYSQYIPNYQDDVFMNFHWRGDFFGWESDPRWRHCFAVIFAALAGRRDDMVKNWKHSFLFDLFYWLGQSFITIWIWVGLGSALLRRSEVQICVQSKWCPDAWNALSSLYGWGNAATVHMQCPDRLLTSGVILLTTWRWDVVFFSA
jgi:hypothetical protein